MGSVDDDVQDYIDAITPANRPLFDRLHQLIVGEFPDVVVFISYQMPTYRLGDRRLYVGSWKHGLSVYGWDADRNVDFVDRHPELSNGKGTIKLPPGVAAEIPDEELIGLVRGALAS
jgi:uncharacterized protein YdhG (YjbR/CyaY superfamily)